MGKFRQWLEDNPHAQFNFPVLQLTTQGPRQMIGSINNTPIKNDPNQALYRCDNCGHFWQRRPGLGEPNSCPRCSSTNFALAGIAFDSDGLQKD